MEPTEKVTYDRWDGIAPIDTRYAKDVIPLVPFLSENAFTDYKLEAECALVATLAELGLCSSDVLDEVTEACKQITTDEVYKEEDLTRHDIRAVVNCIQARVSPEARPFVHLAATSYDIIDTANVARYKAVTEQVLLPALIELEKVLIDLALREKAQLQVGRTHGQHAVPITFGNAISKYVDALGQKILKLCQAKNGLVGKFSGAVGAYNASSLLVDDPREFERLVLGRLGVNPAPISTQIAPPEPLQYLLFEVVQTAGLLAGLSRDMRNLQRTEIAEVGEFFEAGQVGSSTMPDKQNPINFENAESLYKVLVGRWVTVQLDQICEHQRDLTNSASGRTYGEILGYLYIVVTKITKTMKKLQVHTGNMERNLEMRKGSCGEQLYILLAKHGHPDAHEAVRLLTLESKETGVSVQDLALQSQKLRTYINTFNASELATIKDPAHNYIGLSIESTERIVGQWTEILGSLTI